ncbi:hypothetical protein JTB14_014739 [Gonioctena quinquepunctata]|nr:hypothetical protein JTB14_014739 [Gonioctena quinquepunctata]
MLTIVVQIGSILNSRPLLPYSHDPSDLQALTPGHFLIEDSLWSVSQDNFIEILFNRLNSYQQLQRVIHQFRNQWSQNYLHTLHHHRCTGVAQRGQRSAHEMVIRHSGWRPPWQRWYSASSIRAL